MRIFSDQFHVAVDQHSPGPADQVPSHFHWREPVNVEIVVPKVQCWIGDVNKPGFNVVRTFRGNRLWLIGNEIR